MSSQTLSGSVEETISIFMITYNHEPYIRQALDSILSQKVNCQYKIVVGEDRSSDNTRSILQEYAGNHPEKFTLLLNDQNKGWMENFRQTLEACKGRYIAFLEGDDYWTNPSKLQHQLDFLNRNPEYNACFHNARVIDEDDPQHDSLVYEHDRKREVTVADLGDGDYLKFCTLFCRNDKEAFEPIFSGKIPAKDVSVGYCLLLNGSHAYYEADVWAVFRKHFGGVHSKVSHMTRLQESITCLEKYVAYYRDEVLYPKLKAAYKKQTLIQFKQRVLAHQPFAAAKSLFAMLKARL